MRKMLIWILLLILLTACQPRTVLVTYGDPVPEQKSMAPIYVTTTPIVNPRGSMAEWTYDDQSWIGRFTDRVDGTDIVCYYRLERGVTAAISCVALCGADDLLDK